MDKNSLKFDDPEVEIYKFHQHKSPIWIDNIDINKIVVSNKVSFGKKDFNYFIANKDAKEVTLLCIFPPEISAYRRVLIKLNVCLF